MKGHRIEEGKVGRVTPCAPLDLLPNTGAHRVTRPTAISPLAFPVMV